MKKLKTFNLGNLKIYKYIQYKEAGIITIKAIINKLKKKTRVMLNKSKGKYTGIQLKFGERDIVIYIYLYPCIER